MEQREASRRGATPGVSARMPGGHPPGSGQVQAAASGTARPVIGIGAGTRPTGRLSPIVTGGAQAVGPGIRSDGGDGARPAALRSMPPPSPRPMHPAIARVRSPLGVPPTALQAATAAARRGMASTAPGGASATSGPAGAGRFAFGMPSLRRNVCPHFFMTGARGAIPIQAPHLLKALVRQETNVSRCQLRGGVHMEQGYVNDVCLSARFNQCVFYEDDLSR